MTIDDIRQAQWDAAWERGEAQCAAMRSHEQTVTAWDYRPPASDDWQDWTGALRWAALVSRYTHTCWVEGEFRQGYGPFYCPPCGEPHSPRWTARLCLDHWWEEAGYDEAIQLARIVGRQARRAA